MLWVLENDTWNLVDHCDEDATTLTYYPYNNENNLSELIDLNEANCLEALRQRYKHDCIYTYSSNVLIAINPYQNIPIYDIKSDKYTLPAEPPFLDGVPHVYQFVDHALYDLFKNKESQNILVSGESGAGKTQTTGYITEYIEQRCGQKMDISDFNRKQKYYTDVLESFGNAKTRRNDNSSRFGKYLTLHFQDLSLQETRLDTYLLEKIRFVMPIEGEQTFHIVYQLLKEDNELARDLWEGDCSYLHKQDIQDIIDGNTNIVCNHQARSSMVHLGFSETKIQSYHNIIKALLVLGCSRLEETKVHDYLYRFMGVNYRNMLLDRFTYNRIEVRGETIETKWTSQQSSALKDSFVKTTYNAVFQQLVEDVKKSLAKEETTNDNMSLHILGILDIFGFEVFNDNGFEQLCINFANEKLQVQFNEQMIQNQQVEYKEEGIEWSRVDFQGNEKCVSMLETYLFSNLDDSTRLVSIHSNSDIMDIRAISQFKKNIEETAYSEYAFFPKRDPPQTFTIKHFATPVEYNTHTLCERNQEQVHPMIIDMLESSQEKMVRELTRFIPSKNTNHKTKSRSVSRQFRYSLDDLMNRLELGKIHYIRCIKPNDQAKPDLFIAPRVLEQLKYSGLIEANRVARMGYPVRWIFDEFLKRYRPLFKDGDPDLYLDNQPGLVQGKTKYFMKHDCYRSFETDLEQRLNEYSTRIQSIYRKFDLWRRYQITKTCIIMIQSQIRVFLAIQHFIREANRRFHIILLQRNIRLYLHQRSYKTSLKSIKIIQRYTRKLLRLRFTIKEIVRQQRYHHAMSIVKKYILKKIKHKRDISVKLQRLEQKQRLLEQEKHREIQYHQDELEKKQRELSNILEEVEKKQQRIKDLELNRERERDCKVEMLKEIQDIVDENDAMRKELEAYRNYMRDNRNQCIIQ